MPKQFGMKSLPKYGWAIVILVIVLILGAFVVRREHFKSKAKKLEQAERRENADPRGHRGGAGDADNEQKISPTGQLP